MVHLRWDSMLFAIDNVVYFDSQTQIQHIRMMCTTMKFCYKTFMSFNPILPFLILNDKDFCFPDVYPPNINVYHLLQNYFARKKNRTINHFLRHWNEETCQETPIEMDTIGNGEQDKFSIMCAEHKIKRKTESHPIIV